MNAFIDFCMELPEPLRTIQLYTLKSEGRYREKEQKDVLVKILEDRKIELPEDPVKDWTDWKIYKNAFDMKTIFGLVQMQVTPFEWQSHSKGVTCI